MITKLMYLIVFYFTILIGIEIFKLVKSNQSIVSIFFPKYYYTNPVSPLEERQKFLLQSHEDSDIDNTNIITGTPYSTVYDNINLNNKIIEKHYLQREDKSPHTLKNVKFSNSVSDAFNPLSKHDFDSPSLNFIRKR